MKTSSVKESIAYSGLKALEIIVRILPYQPALGLGRFLGSVYCSLSPRKRRTVYRNLKIAFADSKTSAEICVITRRVFQTFGQKFTELIKLANMSIAERAQIVAMDGKQHLDQAMAQGKGVVVLTMHFGSWEIVNFLFSTFGYNYKTFANDPKRYARLDELLNTYRRRLGGDLLSPDTGIREFLQGLKNNNALVVLLSDQGGKDGIPVSFFGRTASVPIGAVRMGMKNRIPVCFAAVIPEAGHKHRVMMHEPMTWIETGDAQKDIFANCRKISVLMEDYIRRYPHEYMWFYKVWKYSSQAKIALLTDGKAGHFNQTLRMAAIMKNIYESRGKTVDVETIKVEYKNRWAQKMLMVLSWIMPTDLMQGRLGLIKPFVTEETYRQISRVSCDVVISTGSVTGLLNHWLARENDARAISILKPSGLSFGLFDAVILPRHDVRGEPAKPVIATEAALNMVDADFLEEQKQKLLNRYSHLKGHVRPKIGVLLGGSSREVYLTSYHVKILMHQLKQVAQEMGAELLITTSRRTSPSIEKFLLKHLKNDESCSLLILSSKQDVPEALGGILGLADLLVVSGDSISMVSEAVASEKKVVVFYPGIRAVIFRFLNKHKRFLDRMSQQGLIAACDVKNVGETISGLRKKKIAVRKNEDHAMIAKALEKIL